MENRYTQNRFDELEKKIAFLEKENLEHKLSLESLKQHSDAQSSLNEIMQVSMLPLMLPEIQERILNIVLNIPWLSLEEKGCIFVVEEKGVLKMAAHRNLSDSLLSMCNKVPFGNCLCGKAAQTKKMIFKSYLDKDHSYKSEGIKPHGHYNTPILNRKGEVIGVLNLYVKHGHKDSKIERIFLESVSQILSLIIERKKLEEQLKVLALIDSLTGLANRRQLVNDLDKGISRANRNNKNLGVLFIDLNKFKPVNDLYGHKIGDELLKQVGVRLLDSVRNNDVVARVGGDEFVILSENIDSLDDINFLINRVKVKIKEPFIINNHQISISTSVGAAIYPEDGSSPDILLNHADKLMFKDKRQR